MQNKTILSMNWIFNFKCDWKFLIRQIISIVEKYPVLFQVVFVLINIDCWRGKWIVAKSHWKHFLHFVLGVCNYWGDLKFYDDAGVCEYGGWGYQRKMNLFRLRCKLGFYRVWEFLVGFGLWTSFFLFGSWELLILRCFIWSCFTLN